MQESKQTDISAMQAMLINKLSSSNQQEIQKFYQLMMNTDDRKEQQKAYDKFLIVKSEKKKLKDEVSQKSNSSKNKLCTRVEKQNGSTNNLLCYFGLKKENVNQVQSSSRSVRNKAKQKQVNQLLRAFPTKTKRQKTLNQLKKQHGTFRKNPAANKKSIFIHDNQYFLNAFSFQQINANGITIDPKLPLIRFQGIEYEMNSEDQYNELKAIVQNCESSSEQQSDNSKIQQKNDFVVGDSYFQTMDMDESRNTQRRNLNKQYNLKVQKWVYDFKKSQSSQMKNKYRILAPFGTNFKVEQTRNQKSKKDREKDKSFDLVVMHPENRQQILSMIRDMKSKKQLVQNLKQRFKVSVNFCSEFARKHCIKSQQGKCFVYDPKGKQEQDSKKEEEVDNKEVVNRIFIWEGNLQEGDSAS